MRSLGWVEIPEEDLAPGKSSIAVNNCIQQLSNSKGQGSAENRGEVRAWDSADKQGPTPGPLQLRLACPHRRGPCLRGNKDQCQWQSQLSPHRASIRWSQVWGRWAV